jgi:hypothetical protein
MATPTLIQHASGSNTLAFGTTVSTYTYTLFLPNTTQAGNCIIVAAQSDNTNGSPAFSIADDAPGGSNTYTLGKDENDTTNVQRGVIYFAMNIKAGTRKIQVTVTGTSLQGSTSVAASEFNNIATTSALDVGVGNFGTSANCTAGSTGALTSGDLLYQVVFQATRGNTYTATAQTNITWKLLSADVLDSMAVQYGIYNSTTSFNPTLPQSSSSHFLSVAVALKSASAGGTPASGILVNSVQHISLFSAAHTGIGYTSPTTIQFPCYGNLIIASIGTGNNGSVTAITDSNSNTWQKAGSGITAAPHNMNIWYSASPTVGSTLTLTVTSSSTASVDTTILLYDVSGAAASPVDTTASASGTQNAAVTSINGPTITPTTANGLIFANIQQEFNTVNSTSSPTGNLLDSAFFSNEPNDGPENVDQNGGWSHFYNPDTSSSTITWGFTVNGGLQAWASYAAAFKAPPAAGSTVFEDDSFNPGLNALLVTPVDPTVSVW